MKESYLYQKLKKRKVQCQTCAHFCVLAPGERGKCGVRENIDGKLLALNYGKAIAINIDPIEKKPFFHFLPGTRSLSIATVGCNFTCLNCQNSDISQGFKNMVRQGLRLSSAERPHHEKKKIPGQKISPQEIVNLALKNNLPSISYTYTEPTIFLEYALDTMKLAREKGLKNTWVTNGFLSSQTLELIAPELDAANVDLKSFDDKFYQENCGGRLQPVLDILKTMKRAPRHGSGQANIWVEVTTLVIPTLSDDLQMLRQIAEFIKNELGPETPWHVTSFSGAISWQLQHLPSTPVETLKAAYQIGKKAGLKYVYTGNIPGLNSEDTFCPNCNALAINRTGYRVKRHDKNGKCSKCNKKLDLILKQNTK